MEKCLQWGQKKKKWFTAAISLALISFKTHISSFFFSKFPSVTNIKHCKLWKMKTPRIYTATFSQRRVSSRRHAVYSGVNEWASIRSECWQNETLYFWAMKLQAGKPKAVARCDWCDRGLLGQTQQRAPTFLLVSHVIDLQDITHHEHRRWMIKLTDVRVQSLQLN